MKKQTFSKLFRRGVLLITAASMLTGMIVLPQADADGQDIGITKLDGVHVDYSQYIDGNVMFRLPDSIASNEEISVIITVDQMNLMDAYEQGSKTMSFTEYAVSSEEADSVRAAIAKEKQQLLTELSAQGIPYAQGHDYDTLLSGFELVITAEHYEAVCKSLKRGQSITVGEVYNVAETQLVENVVNKYETGIFNSSESGYDGSGMVVAVLDTGLDSNHSAFSVDNFTSDKLGLTYEDVAAVLDQTLAYEQSGGLSVDDVYVNEKVPFGYDYADNDPDPYSTHNNHGTHVSGVIVGKDDTITGVAPNAQVVAMKVFSDVMDTARSSWILSALEDCVVLDVDVINMSLGTACGFGSENEEELTNGVYQKIRDAGISLIVAASNSFSSAYGSEKNGNLGLTSNPDTGTVGSPGTYDGTISVASINGEETPYIKYNKTIIYFDETTNGASKENDFFETLLGEETTKKYSFVVVPGVGRTADYTGLDVTGKIALVRRGDNTFEEKAIIAENQGAAGIIIYNNVSGEIKMNVGMAKLAVCSISQDDGEMLAATGGGTLTISKEQTSGPFISDFSSWGPTPDLGIKPEITAHGGNILSSVTGGGYDRLSGTSMACPNLSGVVILLRQYVVENFPQIADDNVKVNAMVNGLLMSTADIAISTNGQPYFVRKQGAGLANLMNAINTGAYLVAYDQDGNQMDKPKLELGDDPARTGAYEMNFSIENFSDKKLTYELGSYVMTEGVSDTKTSAGETTVTEEAYILEGAKVEIVSVNGSAHKGTKISVGAGESAKVTVKLTLSEENKQYLDNSFENGMYVEGFLTLKAKSGTKVDLSVPYLAFYGDWTEAPLFDLDFFETHADELDDSIAKEDKVMADAYATRPIGGVTQDYVSYLGTYYFLQDPSDMIISANRDYVSISNQDGAIHSLRFVWAGLLRNAKKVEIVITDDITGEVIYETVDEHVRKSYGDGGSIYPANIEIEFDSMDFNLNNNSQYTVTVTGFLDYGDGALETNEKNVFQFPLTVDFEAPTITNVEYRSEYDKSLEKNRLFARVHVYDNHYAMAAQLGYVAQDQDEEGNIVPALKSFEQYLTPIYSSRNSTTVVEIELTDYIYEMKEGALHDHTFALSLYDYALNFATYEIDLPADFLDFYFDGISQEGITLSPNEVFTLEPLVSPADQWGELLEFASSKPSVVRVVNNKLVAVASGTAIIKASDPATNKSVTFPVKVLKEGDDGFMRYDPPVADVFCLTGYTTQKAYFIIDNEEKDIGDTGDIRFFEGNYALSLYPSETVMLNMDLDAYFPKDTTVSFESSNEEIVKVDANGSVTAVAEGFASVTAKVMQDGRSTYHSETVSVEVKDPFLTTGASLTHYYGNGGLVVVPEDLTLTDIGNFAFANFDYVPKTEEELAFDDSETSKQWFIGESTITKVILPEGIEKIGSYAFANLTGLEEIVLPSTLEAIEYGAFYGCSSLKKITFSGENNLKIISQNAFENCNLQDTVDLSAVCVISNYAFAGNQELEGVITSEALLSIGEYAFAGCKKLSDVTITANKVKYGPYAFTGCEALTEFYVNAAVLPEGMFYECDGLQSITLGPDVNTIAEFAFRDTAVSTLEVQAGNNSFKPQKADHILSADGSTLVAVAATATGTFTQENAGGASITAIADGAFSHNTKLQAVELPGVTVVGDYGFGSATGIKSVSLGALEKVGQYAFFETAITQMPALSENVQLDKYAFAQTKLTSVEIADGAVLPEGIFAQCADLEAVVIGNDVVVGNYAFYMDKDHSYTIENYNENGEKYFYYTFDSSLDQLTIGDNAVLGESAFAYHAELKAVTLGANAQIGKQAFYNCTALESIDLSKAVSIGDYAFSGDEYYICLDENMGVAAVSEEGSYMTTVHATALKVADLSAAQSIGEYAFAMCEQLTQVILNENITEIPTYAFASCPMLVDIDLSKVQTIGDYAFQETEAMTHLDLSAATYLGKYAFVNGANLQQVILNPEGTQLDEGAFAYCRQLTQVTGMEQCKDIGDYAFAYCAIESIDLSAAENLGKHAFMKETPVAVSVTLGENLKTVGDNPFAMCYVEPLCQVEETVFNETVTQTYNYTFDVSQQVKVIDGSLYAQLPTGLELITYAGIEPEDVKVAQDTVRISSMAFAASDVQMVTMPETVFAIGHKAFFDCRQLHTVVFGSQEAPILEEEFDPTYYENLEHIPGTGDFGSYTDYQGNEVQIQPMGMLPYFMWNVTDGMYSNIFYGANFVDHVGYVTEKLTMIRPVNGVNYDSFIYSQYFDMTIDGANAPDKHTLATIAAIKAIGDRVTYEQRAVVEKARSMYDRIATLEQQALVSNYGDLISAEQRIIALTPTEEAPIAEPDAQDNSIGQILLSVVTVVAGLVLAVVVIAVVVAAVILVWMLIRKRKARKNYVEISAQPTCDDAPETAPEQTQDEDRQEPVAEEQDNSAEDEVL